MAGNENSGPRKTKEMRDALRLALKDDINAPPRNKMDAIVRAHVSKALEGDMAAIKEIYDRIDGKVAQAIVGDSDGDAIQFETTSKEQKDAATLAAIAIIKSALSPSNAG
jgi:hypothetical protein